MPSLHNSDLTAKLLKLIAGGVELSDSDRKNAIEALKALKAQIEKGEDEAPLLLVENCREAGFANLPNKYMGILDKMLGQGSSKYLMGDAKKTFAYDSGSREFVQCVPYKTLELARELDQKKIDKNHDTVGRLLRILVKFEKSWKKLMHQTNSLTVPLTKNDEYTDENGNVVVKAPLGAEQTAGDAGQIPRTVPLNSCFAAQTAEECDARLDGPYGDPGACLWMPYYQHLEGPSTDEEKAAWKALQQTACVPKDKVPFPMRKMDDKDFEALTERKIRKNGEYDERLKMMKPASDAETFSSDELQPKTDVEGNLKAAYSLEKIKQEFRLESALLPKGRDAPYFDTKKFNKQKSIEDLFKGAPTKKGLMARALENQYIHMVATSEQTPQRVKNKMQQSADRYKQISEKILNHLDADTILNKMKTNKKTGNYEWEDQVDRTVYPDFVPILERYARAVYELAKAGELSQDDITKIVSRGSADRDQRSLLVTKQDGACASVLNKMVKVNGKAMSAKQQPIMAITNLKAKGSEAGFVQRKTGSQKALFDKDGNQLVPVYRSKDNKTLDQVIGGVNKEELFVVLRGGGDPFAYNMQQLRAGGSGSVKQNLAGLGDNLKVERDWNNETDQPTLKEADLQDEMNSDEVCLHRVDIGVVMVLKGNYDKYMPMVAAAYDAAGSTANTKAAEEEIIATAKKLRGTTEAHRCLNYLYLTMVHPDPSKLPEGWGSKGDYDKFITKSTMYKLARGNDYYEKRKALSEPKARDATTFSRPITYARDNKAIVPMILTKQMQGGECTSKCDTIPGLMLDAKEKDHVGFWPDAAKMEKEKIIYKGKEIGTMTAPDSAQILYLRTRGFDLATDDNKQKENGIVVDDDKKNDLVYDNIHYNDNDELSVGDGRPKEAPTKYGYEKQSSGYKNNMIPMREGGLTLDELDALIMKGKVPGDDKKKENFTKTMAILEKLQAHISGAPCNELNITQFGWVRD